jgi:hypothetical protein
MGYALDNSRCRPLSRSIDATLWGVRKVGEPGPQENRMLDAGSNGIGTDTPNSSIQSSMCISLLYGEAHAQDQDGVHCRADQRKQHYRLCCIQI